MTIDCYHRRLRHMDCFPKELKTSSSTIVKISLLVCRGWGGNRVIYWRWQPVSLLNLGLILMIYLPMGIIRISYPFDIIRISYPFDIER